MLKRFWASAAAGLAATVALTLLQSGAPAAQGEPGAAPQATFRSEVNYVEEDVRVVGKDGKFITGLKREDFQILEDGKPQKISAFSMVDVPLTPVTRPRFAARDALPIEADVASNEQVLDGRSYLILMDDYHVAPLRSQNARNIARRFVLEKLGANDQAAVISTSGMTKASQDFTTNKHLLLEAIDRFVGQKLPSATLGKITSRLEDQAQQEADNGAVDPITPDNQFTEDANAQERMFKARSSLNSMRSVAEWMAAIQGRRKAIILISEGVDYNLYDMFTGSQPGVFNFENFNLIQQETWDTITAASRSNVQIYPIDPRGLTNNAQENIEIDGEPLIAAHLGTPSLNQELQTSQMNLRQLAEETGGVASVGTNDLDKAFDRIVEENSSYYVIGYYPTNEKRDGKTRGITIKVSGYPDAQVTYRKHYFSPQGKPRKVPTTKQLDAAAQLTAELMQTLSSPLPKTGMPLRVTAITHKGYDRKTDVEVLVQTSGKELTFTQQNGTYNDTLSFTIGIFDRTGKSIAAERPDAKLTLRPETYQRISQTGFRMLRHFSVDPGRYQIRVAAQDSAKTKQGSAHFDLDAPDFTKDALAMSPLVFAATADRGIANPIEKDPFNGGLPSYPTTLREFVAGGEFAVYAEIYDNQPSPSHRIDVTTTVKAADTIDGREVFTRSDEKNSEDLKGAPGGFGHSVRIPLAGWQPGLYVLTVEAKSRLKNVPPVSREVMFKIVRPS